MLSMQQLGPRIVEIDAILLHQQAKQHALEQKLLIRLDGESGKVTIKSSVVAIRLWLWRNDPCKYPSIAPAGLRLRESLTNESPLVTTRKALPSAFAASSIKVS